MLVALTNRAYWINLINSQLYIVNNQINLNEKKYSELVPKWEEAYKEWNDFYHNRSWFLMIADAWRRNDPAPKYPGDLRFDILNVKEAIDKLEKKKNKLEQMKEILETTDTGVITLTDDEISLILNG